MNHPINPNNGSADPTRESVVKLVNVWFAIAVIGLFVFACFFVLKVAVDLFLPIVLAGFLGFLLTPITRGLKKKGLPNFWAPLVGILGFFTLLICLFAALCASLARFEPDLPLYMDHIQERLTPILQAVQKSSPSIDRLGAWLNPGNIPHVNIRGPGFLQLALQNAPNFFAILLIVHVLAFFLLLYGAQLLKKLVDMIPGVSEKQNVVEIAAEIEQTAARYSGDAFLRLKEQGVDADMRVLESASWRPILKNLTLLNVAQFRQQIEEVNLIGVTELEGILAAVRDCSHRPLQAFPAILAEASCRSETLAAIEHIPAKAPKQLRLDRAGFFIVLPQPLKRLIVCEHYENNGRLAHVIEGRKAALIAATVVERGFVTQLDHAAYLGRELAKAEAALSNGITYEQDAALGRLAPVEPHKTRESDCKCS